MWNTTALWMVPSAIALHNLEEALWLPGWSSSRAGRWHDAISSFSFRFAAGVLTVMAFVVAISAQTGGHSSLGFYLLAAYALGQSINIFVPHLAATIATRTCSPGLATGIFFVLPASCIFLFNFLTSPDCDLRRFVTVSLVFIPLLILSIPLLLWVGQIIENRRMQRSAKKMGPGCGK